MSTSRPAIGVCPSLEENIEYVKVHFSESFERNRLRERVCTLEAFG